MVGAAVKIICGCALDTRHDGTLYRQHVSLLACVHIPDGRDFSAQLDDHVKGLDNQMNINDVKMHCE